ncbi:hypothetical protein HPB47_018950 [Ixodes persulcatus]|uniref:Uncharacterized protein n=1 Tax=Ixodes persulcatus TaxID=34615 RepID=A0AC60R0M0_IXOPE|nr:hypothetical protein HPB47_018950 [Ixodes persulcatus]
MGLNEQQGWDDVSFHGSPQIPTPNMDVLAADGIILNNYYVQPLCTPSRVALLSGMLPIHTGQEHFVLSPAKQNQTGLDFWLNMTPLFNETGNYSTTLYTERAKLLIRNRNTAKPLFIYLSYQAVHGGSAADPLAAPEENVAKFPYIGERNRTLFSGITDALDESIGDVFEALYEADMLDNTILVMSSDNGGLPFGQESNSGFNFPLRGAKGTLWEGGTKASAFIWSPLLNQRQRVSNQMMHITDWLPTLYSAAGGSPANLGKVDGFDMWTQISYNLPSSRYEVLYNYDPVDLYSALRYTTYKLVLGTYNGGVYDQRFRTPGGSRPYGDLEILMAQSKAARILRGVYNTGSVLLPTNWRQRATVYCNQNVQRNFVSQASPYLFDLANDPCEQNNIASAQVGILALQICDRALYGSVIELPGFASIEEAML